jgi:hypothetical protein
LRLACQYLRRLMILTRSRLILQEFHLLGGELLGVAVETLLRLLRLLYELLERVVLISRHSALRLVVQINLGAVPSGYLPESLLAVLCRVRKPRGETG